jgi:coatomer subunit delta
LDPVFDCNRCVRCCSSRCTQCLIVVLVAGIYAAPKVNSCDGDWRFDSSHNCLIWTVDLIDDSNRSGAMEVVVASAAPDNFFPCTVSFTAKETLCDITVPACSNTKTQASTRFGLQKQLQVSSFEVLH